VIELGKDARYFSIAQTVRRPAVPHPQPQPRYAIALGCELKFANKLVYSAGRSLDAADATPIGVNCRLCEREHCSQRAEPPLTRTLILDETTRGISSFLFTSAREV
jgi:predicted transcriptional regulator